MPKYLVTGEYIGDGISGLLKEGGTARRAAVKALVKSVGGKLDALYYGTNGTDVIAIADLPDDKAAAAVCLTVNSTGAVSIDASRILTPEELDAAVKKSPKYRAPGA